MISCDYYDCEPCEFVKKTTPKARKQHICRECGDTIEPGEIYERVTGVWDGEFDSYVTCEGCLESWDILQDAGAVRIMGTLKEAWQDYWRPE